MKETMWDDPPYILDIEGLDDPHAREVSPDTAAGRRWIGVRFDCCGAYTRVYVNRQKTAYEGKCPRCLRTVKVRIGPGGTNARMFKAT